MKICHVSLVRIDHQSPEQWVETIPYFTKILEALAEDHELVSFHNSRGDSNFTRQGVMYHFIPLKYFVRLIKSFTPDVIIIHGWHSIFELYRIGHQLRNHKIFIQHHGERIFGGLKSFLQKRFDKNITGYFFSSAQIGKTWVEAGLINPGKVFEVFEVASSFSAIDRGDVKTSGLTFLWVGRLDQNKDPITLIDGFISFVRENPKANLRMIFKEEKLLNEITKRVEGFENNIELIGKVRHDEMKSFYQRSEFIVSTSLFEAGGVSVLEGISMGCIPILTDIPPFRTITDDGKIGILFSPQSSADLTNAFRKAVALNLHLERQTLKNHFETRLSDRAIAAQISSAVNL